MSNRADIEWSKVYLQRFSANGDGMHVEICPANELGQQTYPEPILIIKADREQEFKCVMYTDTGSVSIPLSELE